MEFGNLSRAANRCLLVVVALLLTSCVQKSSPKLVLVNTSLSVPIDEISLRAPICKARLAQPRSCDSVGVCSNLYFHPRDTNIPLEALPIVANAVENPAFRDARSIVVVGLAERSRDGKNAQKIARERAMAVSRALKEQGLSKVKMEIRSNAIDCTGSTADVQDRRVEIFPRPVPK